MTLPNAKTFGTLQAEIAMEVLGKVAGALASSTDRPSADQVKQFLNDSVAEVCTESDWSWLYFESTFSTVVGKTTPYTMTLSNKGVAQIYHMAIQSLQQTLVEMRPDEYDRALPGGYTNIGNGTPQFYVRSYNDSTNQIQFLLGPCPAAEIWTVTFSGKYDPQALSSSGDYSIIPARWQELVKLKALCKIYRMLGPGSAERYVATVKEYERLFAVAWQADFSDGVTVRTRRDSLAQRAGVTPTINQVLFGG
jgi:hypothetical protein